MIELRIGGESADIKGGSDAPRVYKIGQGEEGVVQGDYTLNMSLPRTANNDRLLSFTGAYQGVRPYTQGNTLEASLLVDGVEVLTGTLIVLSVDPSAYSVVLRGANVGWADIVRGLSLQDLTFDPIKYSGVRGSNRNPWPDNDSDTVALHELWDKTEAQADYCMPLVGFGNFACSAGNSGVTNPLEPLLTIGESAGLTAGAIIDNYGQFGLDWSRFKPAVYLRAVIRRIFEQQGFRVSGSLFNDPRLDNVALPYVGDGFPVWNWGLLAQYKYEVAAGYAAFVQGIRVVDPSVAVATLTNVYVFGERPATYPATYSKDYSYGATRLVWGTPHAAHQFYAPQSGSYKIRVNIDNIVASVVLASGTPPVTAYESTVIIGLYKYPGPDPVPTFTAADESPFVEDGFFDPLGGSVATSPNWIVWEARDLNSMGTLDVSFNVNAYLQKGEAISLVMMGIRNRPGRIFTTSFTCRYDFEIDYADPADDAFNLLQPANFLPDIPQVDLLKSIFDALNVRPVVDLKARTVVLQTSEERLLSPLASLDWERKADINTIKTSPPDIAKTYSIEYEEQDDDIIVATTDPRRTFTQSTNIPTARGSTKVEIGLSYVGNRNYAIYNSDEGNLRNLPMACFNTAEQIAAKLEDLRTGNASIKQDYTPALLRLSVSVWDFNTSGVAGIWVETEELRQAYSGPTYSGNAILPVLVEVPELGASTLYEAGYAKAIAKRLASCAAEIEAMLTPADIQGIDVRIPVRIGGQAWYIVEVSGYNPDRIEPTTVKLLRV